MTTLLLVEDDESLGTTLSERLRQEGYQVKWCRTRAHAQSVFKEESEGRTPEQGEKLSLVIMDIGLPDGSGLDLARDIKMASDVPLVFLSAMGSAEYRLEGFEIGAEDYIPKPFHLKELLLRIRRVLEKRGEVLLPFRFEGFYIDIDSRAIIFTDGAKEFPTTRDFELLITLVRASPRVLSRDDLYRDLWSNDNSQSSRTVDNSIMRLRQTLGDKASSHIRSVRGMGYQWL